MNKKEALAALVAGKKIRQSQWHPGVWVCLSGAGNIVLRSVTRSGLETCQHYEWSVNYDEWEVVPEEVDLLADALLAADELEFHLPTKQLPVFHRIRDYLTRRQRDLGMTGKAGAE